MSYVNSIWLEGQRQRWLRHDAHLWVRHDAHLFAPPGSDTPKSYAARLVERQQVAEAQAAFGLELKAFDAEHAEFRRRLADLKFELAWRRLCRKYGYSPNQPRVPAGNPDAGQWTDGEGGSGSPKVRLAAMSWDERRRAIFGQRDLFSSARGEGGAGGTAPSLPSFRTGGPTAGVLQSPGRADTPLVSGTGGPASKMSEGASGFNLVTRTHVEGQAAAIMRESGVSRGTLYINNPEICSSCSKLLPRMLPSGTTLDVILPSGKINRFVGGGR